MAKRKKRKKKKTTSASTPVVSATGAASLPEVYCHHCKGMVNGNGCAEKDCPVRP